MKPNGSWTGRPADTIVLDYDQRHRRRIAMTAVRGLDFLLDLQDATVLRGGDALLLDDGRLVEIVAAPEALVEIRCAEPRLLLRLAWHLGNRHLPVEILGQKLRIRQDHVIEGMLTALGAVLRRIEAPFDPEGGAYGEAGAAHGHGHGHAHDHAARDPRDHDHGHHHDHAHGPAHRH